MATVELPYYTVDEYLAREARALEKSEYYRGVIYAMGDLDSSEVPMSTVPIPYYSVDEYLAREAKSLAKSEYYRGVIYAMAGAKPNHAEITARITHLLLAKLEGGPCKVFSNDLRVKTKDDLYAYPDITVVCQKPIYEKRQGLETLMNPTMLVEVASPTTEGYDRGVKFRLYQELDSLQDYLIVAQDYAGIDHYARHEDGWLLNSYCQGEVVKLGNLKIELPLDEVYLGIEFPHPPPTPPDLYVVRDHKPKA